MTTPDTHQNDLQTARIMLMIYRQGWLDCVEHMRIAARSRPRELKEQYDQLAEVTE